MPGSSNLSLSERRAGDQIRLALTGPAGLSVRNTGAPLAKYKAHFVAFIGRRRPASGWQPGRYRGRISLLRRNQVILSNDIYFDLQ